MAPTGGLTYPNPANLSTLAAMASMEQLQSLGENLRDEIGELRKMVGDSFDALKPKLEGYDKMTEANAALQAEQGKQQQQQQQQSTAAVNHCVYVRYVVP